MEGTRIALALPAPPIISRKSAKAAVGSRQQTQIAADSFSQRHKGACSATLGPVLSGVCSDPVSQRSWLSLVLSGACSVAKCRPVLSMAKGACSVLGSWLPPAAVNRSRLPTSWRACRRGAKASRARHSAGPSIPAATPSTCLRGVRLSTSWRARLRGAKASKTRHSTGPSIPAQT